MNKQLIGGIAALLMFSNIALHANSDPFDGAYIGLTGGYSHDMLNHNFYQQNNAALLPQIPSFNINTNVKQNIGFGQLFAGYAIPYTDLFFGAIEGNISVYQDSNSFNPRLPFYTTANLVTSQVGREYGLQLSVLPGLFIIEDTLLYGRIGYGYERYKSELTFNIPFVTKQTTSYSAWVSELILGVGLSHPIVENLNARIEYNYISSAAIKGAVGNTAVLVNGTGLQAFSQYTNTYHLNSNSILFSLSYNLPF